MVKARPAVFWVRLLLQRSQRTPARKRLESKGEITMLPQTLELRHGARARLRWRQAFFQRCEAVSRSTPRQWEDSLTIHLFESRPRRAVDVSLQIRRPMPVGGHFP